MAGFLRAIAVLSATSMVVCALENTVGSGAGGRVPVSELRRGVRVAGDDYALPALKAASGFAPQKWSSGVAPRQGASRNNSGPIDPRTDTSVTINIENGEVSTVINSPNYPRRYPNNYKHTWTITATIPGSVLRVHCVDSHISCKGDYLQFTDRSTGIKSERLCGQVSPLFWRATNSLDVTFKTNRRLNSKGFKCLCLAIAPPSVTKSTTTPSVTTPTSPSTAASTSVTTTSSSRCECGQVNRATRIVGGEETEVNEYPWQVRFVGKWGFYIHCAGSIINEEWILTSANCVDGMAAPLFQVVIGEHNLTTTDESLVLNRVGIVQVIVHPKYDESTHDNDIALVQLDTSFTSINRSVPVCMPDRNNLYENVDAIVTGWGDLSETGPLSQVLMEVTVSTMTNKKCTPKAFLYQTHITANMICASKYEEEKDFCKGDSGGPLVTSNGEAMELIGVASWSRSNCGVFTRIPGVYSRVGNYLDWITSHVGVLYFCKSN